MWAWHCLLISLMQPKQEENALHEHNDVAGWGQLIYVARVLHTFAENIFFQHRMNLPKILGGQGQ